jgi:mannose-6-phosphate isomerase-like protein (cupin superfamily)
MKMIKKESGNPYEAKAHFGCWSVRKMEAAKDSRRLSISLSHFLPQGGAEMSSSPKERAYFILSGSMLVKGKTEEYRLSQGDLIYIAPGEEREVQVIGTEPVTSLVIIVDVD